MILPPAGSNRGFRLVQIRTGKVAEKVKMSIKKEGFQRSKTAESPFVDGLFLPGPKVLARCAGAFVYFRFGSLCLVPSGSTR